MSVESLQEPKGSVSDPLSRIRTETDVHDANAKNLQQTRWRIASRLIVLGPAAVFFSTTQFVWHGHGAWDLVFEGLDAGLLVVALVLSIWHVGASQHEEWIRERLCTEILRRERFLFAAGVGPYLRPGVPPIQVEDRLNVIGSQTRDLVGLVPMVAEPGGPTWRDELEDSRGKGLPLPDLPLAINQYLECRVEYQKQWFAGKGVDHAGRASGFERLVLGILVLAVIFSLLHFRESFIHPQESTAQSGQQVVPDKIPLEARLLFFGGICLTLIGVATAGFQALLENDRLSRSYAYHSSQLEGFASRLRKLQSELALRESTPEEIQFRFKRIVLDVEGMFSEELMQWRLVMEPRAPRADP